MKKLSKAFLYLTLCLIAFYAYSALTHPSESALKVKAESVLNYKFQDSVEVIKKSGIFWGGFQGDYSINGTMILSARDFEQVKNILEAQMLKAKVREQDDMTLPSKLEYQVCPDSRAKLCVEIWHPFEKADETFFWSVDPSNRHLTFKWVTW